MAVAARQTISKIVAVIIPVAGFVAIGFEHCIANMFFIPAGIFFSHSASFSNTANIDPSNLGWISFVTKNLIPVTLGNLLGGIVFVSMSYWGAYVMPTHPERSVERSPVLKYSTNRPGSLSIRRFLGKRFKP